MNQKRNNRRRSADREIKNRTSARPAQVRVHEGNRPRHVHKALMHNLSGVPFHFQTKSKCLQASNRTMVKDVITESRKVVMSSRGFLRRGMILTCLLFAILATPSLGSKNKVPKPYGGGHDNITQHELRRRLTIATESQSTQASKKSSPASQFLYEEFKMDEMLTRYSLSRGEIQVLQDRYAEGTEKFDTQGFCYRIRFPKKDGVPERPVISLFEENGIKQLVSEVPLEDKAAEKQHVEHTLYQITQVLGLKTSGLETVFEQNLAVVPLPSIMAIPLNVAKEVESLIIDAYYYGDPKLIWFLSMMSDAFYPFGEGPMRRFVEDRNHKWWPKIKAYKVPSAIAVGASHLYGESGLLTKCLAEGGTVEVVKNFWASPDKDSQITAKRFAPVQDSIQALIQGGNRIMADLVYQLPQVQELIEDTGIQESLRVGWQATIVFNKINSLTALHSVKKQAAKQVNAQKLIDDKVDEMIKAQVP